MAPVTSSHIVGKPRELMSYQEQRRQKLEEYLERKKYANSVAIQARSRLENRVYLKDKTNFDKVRIAKWQKEATVCEGKQLESKKPVPNSTISQSCIRSKSALSKQREKLSVQNTNSVTIKTKMSDNQIAQSENLPSSAQENHSKVGQKSKGNNNVAPNKTRMPVQQTMESEKMPFNQKHNSLVEQKGKMHPRAQNATLSQSYFAMKNEQVRLIAEKSNKLKPPTSTFKKPVLGSFRGRIVESKIQSFRSTSQQSERRQKSDPQATRSETEIQNKESRVKLHKPRPKGVENVQPVQKLFSITTHNKQKGLTAAYALSTTKKQKPTTTDMLNIKIDFKPSGKGDTTIVATQTITTKRITAPSHKAPRALPARLPAWKLSGHIKDIEPTAEKRKTQLMSKGKLVKRPEMTPLQKKKSAEEPVKSLWTTIMEEENQSELVNKINQSLSECLNRINEGCPSEDILQTLETFIESVPKAKKFARYWICLAYLEQRKGSVHDVMAVYEQAVKTGAQPAEELRNTLADILRNTKTPKKPCDDKSKIEEDGAGQNPELALEYMTEKEVEEANNEQRLSVEENEYPTNDPENLPLKEQEICPSATDEQSISRDNEDSFDGLEPAANVKELSIEQEVESAAKEQLPPLGQVVGDVDDEVYGAQPEGDYESKETEKIKNIKIEDMKTPVKQTMTPSKLKDRGSSVKYNVKATPKLQRAKNQVPQDNCNSEIKDLKFLTPVRRSRRIEQESFQLPLMLQDHDPCVSSLDDLKNLAGVSTAYVFRKNDALQEYANVSAD
ncbi:cytoskeleton-associated protein 2-like [Pristis pectinata]|uniref:cytoskeleton-associated protein 2-like n=1 Tax=Pristis pectinata TaxID=685728 RepID=UPI00223E2CBC|nr:cytoskeleton-associated protein 2-like [Pristis pectinata]